MIDRRTFLTAAALTCVARADEPKKPRGSFGIQIDSYPIRRRVDRDKGFDDPHKFLEFCRERGADGIQLPLGTREADDARKLRAAADRHGMYVEGSTRPPKARADVERFEAEIRTAREAGATVVRTVMLGGRRYEVFRNSKDYAAFAEQSLASLRLAEPVMARHKGTLAVETHKDYRTDELIGVMKTISSEHIGVCIDTGNNLALLEHPVELAETLAPWAACCHLKDMAVEEMPEGFFLAEVPLGDGILDLKRIIDALKKSRPAIRFSLEMITRDPLRIPCLTDDYWATFEKVPGRDLARTLALVKKHAPKESLPRISKLKLEDQLAVEEKNVRRSLEYGRAKLGL
ncbi:MAG TPA: sugar phosphate isomerase/epimerase family protein [Gemmataceae bacterium]|nr:sugar phosphate isomerase/epimerase family protein [Gemmataceae bacterium]